MNGRASPSEAATVSLLLPPYAHKGNADHLGHCHKAQPLAGIACGTTAIFNIMAIRMRMKFKMALDTSASMVRSELI